MAKNKQTTISNFGDTAIDILQANSPERAHSIYEKEDAKLAKKYQFLELEADSQTRDIKLREINTQRALLKNNLQENYHQQLEKLYSNDEFISQTSYQKLMTHLRNPLYQEYASAALHRWVSESNDKKRPILAQAVLKKQTEFAKLLLESQADINFPQHELRSSSHYRSLNFYHENSALHAAATNNNIEMMELLIEKGAKLDIKNDANNTPLHEAILRGNTEAAKLLIERGANLSLLDGKGTSMLARMFESRISDKVAMTKLLLKNGMSPNIHNMDSSTPLHHLFNYAGARNKEDGIAQKEIAMQLIKAGADLNITNEHGESLIHYLTSNCGHDLVAAMLDTKRVNSNDINEALDFFFKAPDSGIRASSYAKIFNDLLRAGADVKVHNEAGQSLLYSAMANKNETIFSILANSGIDLNLRNEDGKTALYNLFNDMSANTTQMATILLNKGVDPNISNKEGDMLIDHAVAASNWPLVKAMKNAGLSPLALDHATILAFVDAIDNNNVQRIDELSKQFSEDKNKTIDAAFDSKFKTQVIDKASGDTLLSYAVKTSRPDIAAYLIKEGFKPEAGSIFKEVAKKIVGQTLNSYTEAQVNPEVQNAITKLASVMNNNEQKPIKTKGVMASTGRKLQKGLNKLGKLGGKLTGLLGR